MASAQKLYGFLNSAIIVHAASIRVRFFPIWSFVQDLAEIKMVGCMTSSVYGLCPKVVWILELRHHCSCCINQSAILSDLEFCSRSCGDKDGWLHDKQCLWPLPKSCMDS